jgi:hypothetical protein
MNNENFLVICDETNNPPQIVEQNMLCVDVYVKPCNKYELRFTIDKDGKVIFTKSDLEMRFL